MERKNAWAAYAEDDSRVEAFAKAYCDFINNGKTERECVAYGEKLAKAHGFDLVVSGEPALFYLRIANDDSLMLHQEWVAECVSRGLFLASHHNHFINAALTDEDIALAVDIADDAFGVVEKRHPELKG